jgi:2'-5' RNA ligase
MQAAIATEIVRLESEFPGVQWIDPRRMHLTLRFLGWTVRARLSCLEPYLAVAAKACPPIAATISGLGTFPPTNEEKKRVLWGGRQPASFRHRTPGRMRRGRGYPPERRVFHPHLTIGRFKDPARLGTLPKLDLGATRLENLVIYRTEPLKGETAMTGIRRPVITYSKLVTFSLG